jgi:hypothetical protein
MNIFAATYSGNEGVKARHAHTKMPGARPGIIRRIE